jgi:hypothetical protein
MVPEESSSRMQPSRITLGSGGMVGITTKTEAGAAVTVMHVHDRCDAEVILAPPELAAVVRELAARLRPADRAELTALLSSISDGA